LPEWLDVQRTESVNDRVDTDIYTNGRCMENGDRTTNECQACHIYP